MQKDLENREASNMTNRKKKPAKKPAAKKPAPSTTPAPAPAVAPAKSKAGRPPETERQEAQNRAIVWNDDKGNKALEKCPACGRDVFMKVYAIRGHTRYATCPHARCKQRVAIKGLTIRKIGNKPD